MFRTAGLDEQLRGRQRIHEATTHRLDIERGTTGNSELGLQDARGTREHHIRRSRSHDDKIDVLYPNSGVSDGRLRCSQGQVACNFIIGGGLYGKDGTGDGPGRAVLDIFETGEFL